MKSALTTWGARFGRGLGAASGLALIGVAGWALGCGSDSKQTATSTGGGQSKVECPEAPQAARCTVAVEPSSDDYNAIQTALGEAKAGSTICLCPGTFHVGRELDLATERITFMGAGAGIEDAVLDFATQTKGDKSVAVTGSAFNIQNMWIKNSPGDGVDVTGATTSRS